MYRFFNFFGGGGYLIRELSWTKKECKQYWNVKPKLGVRSKCLKTSAGGVRYKHNKAAVDTPCSCEVKCSLHQRGTSN